MLPFLVTALRLASVTAIRVSVTRQHGRHHILSFIDIFYVKGFLAGGADSSSKQLPDQDVFSEVQVEDNVDRQL